MNASATTDILRGELERLFDLDQMKALCSELLGFDPETVGGTAGKGAFARALVEQCAREDALEALADAILLSAHGVDQRIRQVFEMHRGEELRPGTNVAGYRILKKVGEGGLGVVYLGEQKDDGGAAVRVALKVIRPEYARDRAAVRRYLTVSRVLKTVRATGLANILAVGQLDDGRPWVAQEFIEGHSLSSRIGRIGPMHFNEARRVMRGVLDALGSLHARGIVHGDVKAENVFVVRQQASGGDKAEASGVLVDGGTDRLLSRGISVVDQTGFLNVFGTPKAISPEQARGLGVSQASDLYAMGTLLYEVVTGKPPFAGASAIDVVAQHLTKLPDEPSKVAPKGWVPRELDDVILRALSKDPADRYKSTQHMIDALEAVGRHGPTLAPKAAGELDSDALERAAAALRADPTNEDRALDVERVVEPARAWAQAIQLFWEIANETTEAETKKSLLFKIARIEESELKNFEGSEGAYKKILEIDPNDEIAQIGIEELRRASGNVEGLVDLLLEKVEREQTSTRRAALLREIAEIYEEHLSQPDNAFVAWVQALGDDPRDERTVRKIERLADTPDRWNEALQTLSDAVQNAGETDNAVHLYTLMGRWYADRLQRPDFAMPCYQQALGIDPSNEAALDGTVELYKRAQAWAELATMLQRRAEITANPARARDFTANAAEIIHKRLNDAERAGELFMQVLRDDPMHPKAAQGLEEILTERKDWAALVKLLEAKSHEERGETKVLTLCHMAELYEDRLGDAEQAAVQYEAALAHDARNLVALKGLERLYAKASKFQELLLNLRTQMELAATPRQRIGLLERIGSIQEEEFVDYAKAAETFELIVGIDPGHDGSNAALARLYRQLHRFDELALTLDRHAKGTEDEKRKIDLLLNEARVLMVDVGAPDRAVAVCERILAIDSHQKEALDYIARLKTTSGDAKAALDAVERLAKGEQDATRRAELWVRAGKILEERGDNDGAISRFKLALDSDRGSADAASALRAIYTGRGDAHGAAELLRAEIEMTEGAISKGKLFAELGTLSRERLHDRVGAHDAFRRALELDPTSTPAAHGLGDMAFEEENWAEAARYLEPLLGRTSEMQLGLARDVSMRCGDAFRALGDFPRAQRAYLNAKAFGPNDREVLERVADVTFESGAPDEAAELYRDIALRFREQLMGGEKARILYRLGESARRSGDVTTAIRYLNEAAELMPEEALPLEGLRRLYESQNKWEDVVRTMRRRMDHASDEERFQLLVEVGDILAEKIGDRSKAAKAYVAALELRADDRNLLTKLMAVYSESNDWSRLVEVILRIAELVEEPKQLGKYYNTAAAILHQKLGRVEEAGDYYDQALDNDPVLAKAFEGLVECLTQRQDWDRLEEAYRNQLKRTEPTASPEHRAHLWDSLAEILHHRLSRVSDAVEAYEEAAKLDPENRRRAELLADIYSAEPRRHFQKAVAQHAMLLHKSPYRIESYQALRRLYTELKRADEAWCVCQALRCLNMAEPDEEAFFKKHRQKQPATVQERVSEEIFQKHVLHPELDPLLTGIFATITPAVAATRSQPLQAFGVDPARRLAPETDQTPMAQMLVYASGVTQIPLPELYFRESDPGGLSFLFAQPPSIGLGMGALAGGPPQALAFVSGRHLAYFRAGHYLRHLVPTGGGLRAWLLAAIKTVTPQFPISGDLATLVNEHIGALRQTLPAPHQDTLRSYVQKLLAAAPELDMKRWVAAVDLTADRVGFILANDLEIATAVVRASPDDAAAVPQKERLKELYLYAVSESYLGLRHRLGITIGG